MRENETIELIRARDERGAAGLLRHYGPLMRYIAAPILKNPQDIEDCVSETVMRVWERIGAYSGERGSWTAWLTAVTRNTALNRAKRLAREPSGQEIPEDEPSPEPTPEERLLLQERRRALARALDSLAQEERLLLYRKYYYLQSTSQIAAELGMTERAVEGRLYRLKKSLRAKLGGDRHE